MNLKHVFAFDVSMGKSTMVVYNGYQKCELEVEIQHNKSSFKALKGKIVEITKQDVRLPK